MNKYHGLIPIILFFLIGIVLWESSTRDLHDLGVVAVVLSNVFFII